MFYRMRHGGCGGVGGNGRRSRWGGGEEASGGGRMRRFFEQGDLRLLLLELIAERPRHGYDLIREIEARVGGAYAPSPGVVYPTLTLLDEMGLIEAQASEGAKRQWAITEAGRAHLAENRARVDELVARMDEVRSERERGDYTPVMRAMANLRTALRMRLARGEVTGETVRHVAAAIDEVAAKVDRL